MKQFVLALLFCLVAVPATAQLSISDFVPPTGHGIVMLVLLESQNTTFLCQENNCPANVAEGSLAIAPTLVVNRDIELQVSNTQIRFRRLSTFNGESQASFSSFFSSGQIYDDARVFAQTAVGVLEFTRFDAAGGGFARWDRDDILDQTERNMTQAVDGIIVGTRVIVAITSSAAQTDTDNCELYFGNTDLMSPSDLRLGLETPSRLYLGSALVCGAAP